jgi:hypothetical protein
MFYLPTQLPSGAQTGIMGRLFKRVNPLESVGHWLEKIIVNNRNPLEFSTDPRGGGWLWLVSPAVLAVLVLGALTISASLLQLEAQLASAIPGMAIWKRRRRKPSSKQSAAIISGTHGHRTD